MMLTSPVAVVKMPISPTTWKQRGQPLEAKVALGRLRARGLVLRVLAEGRVGQAPT
jgi:hypothetical protein